MSSKTKQTEQQQRGKLRNAAMFGDALGFRAKFFIGTALVLLLISFMSAYLIYELEKRQLQEQAYSKTELVMAAVESSRAYIREDLRPRMYEEFGQDFFMLQAMSTSYVSRAVMENFNQVLPEYEYRRVAENARNPDSEANELEISMLERFQEDPEQQSWQGMLQVQGQEQFMRFKPVYFRESCMSCHGEPEDAPRELLQRYGEERGFGNEPGDLAGVVAVGFPVQKALAAIKDSATSVFFVLFSGLLLFFLAVALIFQRVVVHNMRGVLSLFKENIEDKTLEDFLPRLESNGKGDELEQLNQAAETMSEHLKSTRQELKQYTQNLEQEVAQRTQALQESERVLQEKVKARNWELKTLNRISELTTQAQGLSDVWRRVLQQSLELIPARGAGVYIFQEDDSLLELQYQQNALQLPLAVSVQEECRQSWQQQGQDLSSSICQALAGRLSSASDSKEINFLNIPMACRGRVLGVLSFLGLEDTLVTQEQQELLLSVGRQVGIAVESLRDLQRLMQNKELLQTVFDGITDLLMLLDREGRIKMVNQAYLHRYGVHFEDVQDQPCFEVHAGLMQLCPNCALGQVVQSACASSEEIACSSGEIFQVHFYPILDETGEVQSVIRYAREVSEQKKVEKKIQHTEKLVALGQLASGVAHEINNPLGIILCYVDLLKRQLQDLPQGQQDLEVIEKQAINCKNIVMDLLQFSRGQESVKEPVQMERIIQEVVQMLRHQLKKNHIQLELDLDQDLPQLKLNADKIKQVLVNLLLNAQQAVGSQGLIQISSGLESGQDRVWISIWDNGPGVEQGIQGKIFDPFFSTKRTGEGTGLGLAVSYGIVQDHGGEIALESEKGAWTRFTVYLPFNS
ncbi:MAG: DUF3365 domain-containing protein [Desulfohalobiaceae bacterium]